jgi:hypothetical protein
METDNVEEKLIGKQDDFYKKLRSRVKQWAAGKEKRAKPCPKRLSMIRFPISRQ